MENDFRDVLLAKYRNLIAGQDQEIEALKEWQKALLPLIERELQCLSDHIAMCEMEIAQGKSGASMMDPHIYLADISKEHTELFELYEQAGGGQNENT